MLPYIIASAGGYLLASGLKRQSFSGGGNVEGRIEKLKAELDSAYDVYFNVFDEEERADFVSTIQDKIEAYRNLLEDSDDEYIVGVMPLLEGLLNRIKKSVIIPESISQEEKPVAKPEEKTTMREKIAAMNISLNTITGDVYVGGSKNKNKLFSDEKGYYLIEGYDKFLNKKYPIKKYFSESENEVLNAYMQNNY